MTAPQQPPQREQNPVLEEIWAIRERMWREAGGTAKGYVERMRRLEAERRKEEQAAPERQKRKSA